MGREQQQNRLCFTLLPDGRIQETRYTSFGQTDKTLEWPAGTSLPALIAAGPTGPTTGARVTSITYDARGNVTSTTLPDGTFTAAGYDLENRTVWSQDARGYRTFTVYDEVGRPRFTIQPDADDGTFNDAPFTSNDPRLANNPRSETLYDLVGRVTLQIDERGATTETRYFADTTPNAGRREKLVQHLDGSELVTTYAYYPSGQVRAVTDPRNHTTGTRYDSHGRPVRMLYPATDEHPATETLTAYNLIGQRVATTDQAGKVTHHRHDALGRLVEVRQYLDQSLAASDSGFIQATTAAGIVSITYSYDEAGQMMMMAVYTRLLFMAVPAITIFNRAANYITNARLYRFFQNVSFSSMNTTQQFDRLVRAAQAQYPRLVGWDNHHILPQYIRRAWEVAGIRVNSAWAQIMVRIPNAYHQVIHNEISAGITARKLDIYNPRHAGQILDVIEEVISRYPLS